MPNDDVFTVGLTRIAIATGKDLGEATVSVYREAIAPKTKQREWTLFCQQVVSAGRWRWFPTVREILDALAEYRGQPSLDAEAVAAYERVLRSGNYHPEGGTTWDVRTITQTCGGAAAEAFLSAGGHNAFATEYREDERRRKFVDAYQRAARAEPGHRLLPAPAPQRFLPAAGATDFEPISRGDAADILAKLAGMNAGEGGIY